MATQAWTLHEKDGTLLEVRAETAFVLARAMWANEPGERDRAQARGLAQLELDTYAAAGDSYADTAAEIRSWQDVNRRLQAG